jgi:methylenetetrahydrofolate reductase (NADPH)|tara:strand:+ start:107 stop:1009 length:903 start_codon:yes stop_codon:yes gene_type:complete
VKTNQTEINIKSLIKDFSIETTPKVYSKYGQFGEFLHRKNHVYITYLPDEKSERVIDTAKKLNNEKFKAIPHLPARNFMDNSQLEKYIGSLSEIAGCEKILVIGGPANQKGSIASSLDVLQTDLLSKYNFKEVGLAGHPEGSSDVPDEELDKAIIEKNQFAKNADYKMYLATQFFFDSSSFLVWEKHLETLNNCLDIHTGIPGPATLKTLVYYAASCGIGNSINFLSKQGMKISKIATTRTPDKLIADLADYKNNNPSSKLCKLHFYAFGGIKKTSEWLNLISNSPLEINSNNEFKPKSE